MSDYPILVEHFGGKQSMMIVCPDCHAERVIGPDDISNEMLYDCPRECGGWAVYKYDEGTRCKGCGDMHWDVDLIERKWCSQRCKLQGEYARELEARKRTA